MTMNRRLVAAAVLVATTGLSSAHGDRRGPAHEAFDPAAVEDTPFGQAADPARAARVIRVTMDDRMRFTPAVIHVKRGETVRFALVNRGWVLHEMVLGTAEDLLRHAELMRKFPDMAHDEPNMLHVKPGRSGSFAWTFDKVGTVGFACLIPGHFEAGMSGKVVVQ